MMSKPTIPKYKPDLSLSAARQNLTDILKDIDSLAQLAKAIFVSARTLGRWKKGEIPIPKPVRILLWLINHWPGIYQALDLYKTLDSEAPSPDREGEAISPATMWN